MAARWTSELWRLLGLLAACVLVGLLTGHVRDFVVLGLAGAIAWHLYNLQRLLNWLGSSEGFDPQDVGGAWGEIYYRVNQLQRRNRKRKRKLAKVLAQFQASAEAMPDAAIALGVNWEIHWFNDAATQLLGLRAEQDVGQTILNLLRNPEFHAYLNEGQFDRSLEIGAPGNSGRRLSVRVIPYAGSQRLLLAQDVTERYRLERVRKDFVANASHELRTPLTVISGFVENLRHESSCPAQWARPLALMEQQTARMQRIVEDLLLLSGLEAGQIPPAMEVVDVGAMIEDIRDEALAAAGPEAPEITVEIEGDAGLVGNSQYLRSAFSNLVVNAVQHTPAGGCIRVRWRTGPEGGVFEVQDTGEGIPAEHLPRLTERFYRVDVARSRRRGGTGLGLAIVKHVLQNHQARLEIESEVGRGSTFRCVFPPGRLEIFDTLAPPLEASA
ncbi:MAG: phosphate regulon sensor histidine kinase PhoR [Gammaproteobacteria bacterium]|jgi:two-component system phosphate regulon sensor histidine kinase PhoR|nr:phosphate regulon sensor histidine kinase PhoR [Gammaproteobacteria bacterium]